MYNAWMGITTCTLRDGTPQTWDVVGPICESGDWLGRERSLVVAEGDLLAITSAGAYAMAMASNYNSRPRAAEVMVDGDAVHLIRQREALESLYAGERLID
jgi:diaminopimelate decarboxylase